MSFILGAEFKPLERSYIIYEVFIRLADKFSHNATEGIVLI